MGRQRGAAVLALFVALALLPTGVAAGGALTAGADTAARTPEARGALKVTLRGLPTGTPGDVRLRGPDGYRKKVTSTTTLRRLKPGRYTVKPREVALTGATGVPVSPSRVVRVKSGETTKTRVTYEVLQDQPQSTAPQILTTSLAPATTGAPYDAHLELVEPRSGSWSWEGAEAPPGLTVSTGGRVTGTPLSSGDYSVTVRFVDSAQLKDTQVVTVSVVDPPPPDPDQWSSIAAGIAGVCGIKTDATAWCWGYNGYGTTGTGSTDYEVALPAELAGGGSWAQIEIGGYGCGRKTDGTAWCWGWNPEQQLGNGSDVPHSAVPVQVTAPGSAVWTDVAVGNYMACGVRSDDTAWCWGGGRMGDGNDSQATTPVQVLGGGVWDDIDVGDTGGQAGYDHVCATKVDDTAWCWGGGYYGELGNGSIADQLAPTEVAGGATWLEVRTGARSACGIRTDHTLWCWGDGIPDPYQVGTASHWASVAPGPYHRCATTVTGTGWCWGYNGALGLGTASSASSEAQPAPLQGAWSQLSTNGDYDGFAQLSCGIAPDQSAWCWGTTYAGTLGDGSTTASATPVRVLG